MATTGAIVAEVWPLRNVIPKLSHMGSIDTDVTAHDEATKIRYCLLKACIHFKVGQYMIYPYLFYCPNWLFSGIAQSINKSHLMNSTNAHSFNLEYGRKQMLYTPCATRNIRSGNLSENLQLKSLG